MTTLLNPQSHFPLPTEEDLPYSDEQPVDNELQLLVPFLLRAILSLAWEDRQDWFMGINIGLYHTVNQPAIGPDALLSLGVPRVRPTNKLRLSYLVWQEGVMPQWVLEVVSQKPGGEYKRDKTREDKKGKLIRYAEMGILYYTLYNPHHWRRDKHDPFEVYRLVDGVYQRQPGNPVWMPELGLGIGTATGTHEGCQRQWLYWYDQQGQPYPVPRNLLQQERQRAEQERQRAEQERQRAEQERQRAEQEQQRAEQEQQRAEQERQEREQAEAQMKLLAQRLSQLDPDYLRTLGIDPETLN